MMPNANIAYPVPTYNNINKAQHNQHQIIINQPQNSQQRTLSNPISQHRMISNNNGNVVFFYIKCFINKQQENFLKMYFNE